MNTDKPRKTKPNLYEVAKFFIDRIAEKEGVEREILTIEADGVLVYEKGKEGSSQNATNTDKD